MAQSLVGIGYMKAPSDLLEPRQAHLKRESVPGLVLLQRRKNLRQNRQGEFLQRHLTLNLCNLARSEYAGRIVDSGGDDAGQDDEINRQLSTIKRLAKPVKQERTYCATLRSCNCVSFPESTV